MPLTQIIGWRGDGKTLFIMKMIQNIQKYLDIRVYANMNINCKNFHYLNLAEIINLPENIILGLDEAYSIIHSRLSMSYINIYMGYVAFQLRKTNINIFLTMQQLRTIDVIYREEWDYKVYCERIPNENEDWRLWDFHYEIHCKRTGSVTHWLMEYQEAKKIFPMYNTNEIIKPRNWSRVEYEFLLSDPENLSIRSLDIAKKIVHKMKKTTKDEVEFALKRSGFDKCWKNDVYIEIKHLET